MFRNEVFRVLWSVYWVPTLTTVNQKSKSIVEKTQSAWDWQRPNRKPEGWCWGTNFRRRAVEEKGTTMGRPGQRKQEPRQPANQNSVMRRPGIIEDLNVGWPAKWNLECVGWAEITERLLTRPWGPTERLGGLRLGILELWRRLLTLLTSI